MTTLTWDRHQGHAYTYDVVDLGYNYRIDEIRSALGLVQLHKLPANNARRKAISEHYWEALSDSSLEFPFRDVAGESAYYIFPLLLPEGADRKAFMDQMHAAGIQTSIHYPPIHQFSYYRQVYPGVVLPETELAAKREVTLPLYPTMSDSDVNLVVSAARRALNAIK
jgi:dTDP-4-amino-4,6-dideoxygalactose transaminase